MVHSCDKMTRKLSKLGNKISHNVSVLILTLINFIFTCTSQPTNQGLYPGKDLRALIQNIFMDHFDKEYI